MPIYEYACKNCSTKIEVLQGGDEAPLTECPSCNQHTLEKLISLAGFRLKGSGWYETDFKSSGRRRIAEVNQVPSDTRSSETASKSSDKVGTTPSPKGTPAKGAPAKGTSAKAASPSKNTKQR